MESDEKDENKAVKNDNDDDGSIDEQRLNITQFDEKFKKYLNNKNNQDNKNGTILFNQMEKDFAKLKQSINELISHDRMIESNKIEVCDNSINVDYICKFIKTETEINK